LVVVSEALQNVVKHANGAGEGGELRIWDPTTGAALTSLRVTGQLSHLVLASTTLAAAGEGGLYFLALCHGPPSRQIP
jgi:hypothetical protein